MPCIRDETHIVSFARRLLCILEIRKNRVYRPVLTVVPGESHNLQSWEEVNLTVVGRLSGSPSF